MSLVSSKGEKDLINIKLKKSKRPQIFFDKDNGIKVFSFDGMYYYFLLEISKTQITPKSELTLDLLANK